MKNDIYGGEISLDGKKNNKPLTKNVRNSCPNGEKQHLFIAELVLGSFIFF